jgi:prepilin-type N-terminal cleavage/methylation domain-containing protein/prepilin-type processing-associated H-X9-DG protein
MRIAMTIDKVRRAFTLIELLVVISIISALLAVVLPVFSASREKARQTTCLSNERQLGLAFAQYIQDNNDVFPNGINGDADDRYWPGEGWAGQCQPYVKTTGIFACPSDPTIGTPPENAVCSFGYNINLTGNYWTFPTTPSDGQSLATLRDPSATVLLFEVSGVTTNLTADREGVNTTGEGAFVSASASGLDNRLYAQDSWTSPANQYATGYLGGRVPVDATITQFERAQGRHSTGSNFVLADGHSRWLPGSSVSSGIDASGSACNQDDIPATTGCQIPAGELTAAGTATTGVGPFTATFSIF